MPALPRTVKISLIAIIAVAVAAGTAGLAVYAAGHLENDPTAVTASRCSSGRHATHTVTIQSSKVIPDHTTAPLCDRLTIVNRDSTPRLITFGLHEHHVPYDGTTEKLLSKGQSLTVTLVSAGNFRFHDHIHDEVQGTFTVTPAH